MALGLEGVGGCVDSGGYLLGELVARPRLMVADFVALMYAGGRGGQVTKMRVVEVAEYSSGVDLDPGNDRLVSASQTD